MKFAPLYPRQCPAELDDEVCACTRLFGDLQPCKTLLACNPMRHHCFTAAGQYRPQPTPAFVDLFERLVNDSFSNGAAFVTIWLNALYLKKNNQNAKLDQAWRTYQRDIIPDSLRW
jgi:hypothetical protein